MSEKLTQFKLDGVLCEVRFMEQTEIVPGVVCETYQFVGNGSADLAIVRVTPSFNTPLQRILKGNKTIEQHCWGKGKLTIARAGGMGIEIYYVGGMSPQMQPVELHVGDLMQWQALPGTGVDLCFSEVCYPPYEEGRFENLQLGVAQFTQQWEEHLRWTRD